MLELFFHILVQYLKLVSFSDYIFGFILVLELHHLGLKLSFVFLELFNLALFHS